MAKSRKRRKPKVFTLKMNTKAFLEEAKAIESYAHAAGEPLVNGLVVIAEKIRSDVVISRAGAGVPRDEGHLANSIRVGTPEYVGAKVQVPLTAGGASVPYALRQHEELTWKHKLGEARYLVRGLERYIAKKTDLKQVYNDMAKQALEYAQRKKGKKRR